MEVGDRVDVEFSSEVWFRGTVQSSVKGMWATVAYDDGDTFNDYFDERPGSLRFVRLLPDAERRLEAANSPENYDVKSQ